MEQAKASKGDLGSVPKTYDCRRRPGLPTVNFFMNWNPYLSPNVSLGGFSSNVLRVTLEGSQLPAKQVWVTTPSRAEFPLTLYNSEECSERLRRDIKVYISGVDKTSQFNVEIHNTYPRMPEYAMRGQGEEIRFYPNIGFNLPHFPPI